MKKCNSKSYFIVSSVQLGTDDEILKVFSTMAKHYKSKVYHLGPLVTDQEFRLHDKHQKALKQAHESHQMLAFAEDNAATDRRIDAAMERIGAASGNLKVVQNIQKERIKKLKKFFPNVEFVTTESVSLPSEEKFIMNGLDLSRKVMLAPIPPAGMMISGKPIQPRAINYLKRLSKSWIVAHPVPSVECFERPGINKAYNFFTVGSLRHSPLPTNTRQQSEFSHMPAAMMVLVDQETGEFHPKQVHVDYLNNVMPNPFRDTKATPMILDDGLVFMGDKVTETKSIDRATTSTDDHAPYQHSGVLGALRALNTLFQPYTLVNMGDAADFTSVCHHIHYSIAKREGLRLKHDIDSLRRLLSAQANVSSIKQKILIDSNHHDWVTQYADENPAMIGLIDWRTLAKEIFPDWDVFITNDKKRARDNIFFFGDYAIRHGHQEAGGLAKAERLFDRGKYLCGHWHRYQSFRRAIMQGCGAMLSPTYLNDKQTAWQNQIATLTKFKDVAACNPKIVLHDKKRQVSRFAYRSEIYEVPHHIIANPYQKIYDKVAEEV